MTIDTQQHLFAPPRAAAATRLDIERNVLSGKSFGTGIVKVDDYLLPFLPGDAYFHLARPGHGKTSFSIWMAKQVEALLKAQNDPRIVVYVTYETTVSEFVALAISPESGQPLRDIAKGVADMGKFYKALAAYQVGKIFVVGRDAATGEIGKMPTLQDVWAILQELTHDRGMPPALVIVDFLQAIPVDQSQKESIAFGRYADFCKEAAIMLPATFMINCQADRRVDNYTGLQLPTLRDGMWTSRIEHDGDKVFSSTIPHKYIDPDTFQMTIEGTPFTPGPNNMALQILKCRWSESGKIFMLDTDWQRFSMMDAVIKQMPF